tara:strand:- start:137 stop:301 length:165 start_codon:yes stop_codon:yes gene_type:complete
LVFVGVAFVSSTFSTSTSGEECVEEEEEEEENPQANRIESNWRMVVLFLAADGF